MSLASALAVMVDGKKIVVPFGFLLGESPGETMNGEMLPILARSSKKDVVLENGELISVALVGRPCGVIAVRGKVLPMRACGEGGGKVGVRGSPIGRAAWGARVKGEYSCPCLKYGSAKLTAPAGARRVGVMGMVPHPGLKNAWLLKIPGESGMVLLGGKMNLDSETLVSLDMVCGCSMLGFGGVELPLLIVSVLGATLLEHELT